MLTSDDCKPANLVQTIARVSLILDTLAQYPQGISLGDLAAKVDLPKGTAHRLLSSMAYFQFVRQEPASRYYYLGFKLVELGNLLLDQIDMRSEARPILHNLAEKVQETVHLVVRDNDKALYIDKVAHPARGGLQMVSRLGAHIPLHCSSVGKVLLAYLKEDQVDRILYTSGLPYRTPNTIIDAEKLKKHLEEIRTQGFAIDDEENEIGIRCVAAPIRNGSGSVEAAVSISGPATRMTKAYIVETLKNHVCETAWEISHKLGYRL